MSTTTTATTIRTLNTWHVENLARDAAFSGFLPAAALDACRRAMRDLRDAAARGTYNVDGSVDAQEVVRLINEIERTNPRRAQMLELPTWENEAQWAAALILAGAPEPAGFDLESLERI